MCEHELLTDLWTWAAHRCANTISTLRHSGAMLDPLPHRLKHWLYRSFFTHNTGAPRFVVLFSSQDCCRKSFQKRAIQNLPEDECWSGYHVTISQSISLHVELIGKDPAELGSHCDQLGDLVQHDMPSLTRNRGGHDDSPHAPLDCPLMHQATPISILISNTWHTLDCLLKCQATFIFISINNIQHTLHCHRTHRLAILCVTLTHHHCWK